MTKTIFLTFYYCTIYPTAFFICAVTLLVNFVVDKFSLMRTWKPSPVVGESIAKFSRTYFMSTAFAAMAIASSYFFSGWPYDNLCAEDVSYSAYYGTWKIVDGLGATNIAEIMPGQRSFQFCNQFLGPGTDFSFPVCPTEQPSDAMWMTAEQEQLTMLYGWISVGVLSLVGALFLYCFLKAVRKQFSMSYSVRFSLSQSSFVANSTSTISLICFSKAIGNKDQRVPFSESKHMTSYIPQALSDQFTHPLLAVNIDEIGTELFDWNDLDRSHSYYDMTRDAEQLIGGNEDLCYKAFSRVRHWPPHVIDEGKGRSGTKTKSALKRHKDVSHKRNISWSSKVTCKTYSKDDANHWVSTTLRDHYIIPQDRSTYRFSTLGFF